MRTPLTLGDTAYATAQAYAQARAIKLGQAVSELIRRGSAGGKVPMKQTSGVWVFDLPANTPKVSTARVRQLLDATS